MNSVILSINATDAYAAGLFDYSKTLTGEDRPRVYPFDTLKIFANGEVEVDSRKVGKLDKKALEAAVALAKAEPPANPQDAS